MRKSEVSEMPSLPRGGGDELVRDEQVSSRRVRGSAVHVVCMFMFLCMGCAITILTVAKIVYVFFQRQLEDYLNKLLRMAMYRKYHHTVSNHTKHRVSH